MQINPFGYPLGAGMQTAPAFGAADPGFAAALGIAIEGGTPPQLIRLTGSATPPANLAPKLAQTLLAQAQVAAEAPSAQPMTAAAALAGRQQPTSLPELMATAARLPNIEPMPIAQTPGVAVSTAPASSTGLALGADLAPSEELTPSANLVPIAAAPVKSAPVKSSVANTAGAEAAAVAPDLPTPATAPPATVPAQTHAQPQPQTDVAVKSPATATLAETASTKPQKALRGDAAATEAAPLQPDVSQPVIPADMLVAALPAQPIPQPLLMPRETIANTPAGSPGSKTGKIAAQSAPTQDVTQIAAVGATADFARAVAATGEPAGSGSNPDSPTQPEVALVAAAKADAAAPVLPQHIQTAPSADPVRAAAPAAAPAEPVIEARAGHLGQSLGVEIARRVELGEETLRIRLNPVELGRIEVTLAFDDKGSLQATVRTESAQAMELLRQDAPDLARTLEQAGVRTDAQSFRFENRSGDSGGQQAQQQQQNRGQSASSDDDVVVAEPIYRPIRTDGQVDLLA